MTVLSQKVLTDSEALTLAVLSMELFYQNPITLNENLRAQLLRICPGGLGSLDRLCERMGLCSSAAGSVYLAGLLVALDMRPESFCSDSGENVIICNDAADPGKKFRLGGKISKTCVCANEIW